MSPTSASTLLGGCRIFFPPLPVPDLAYAILLSLFVPVFCLLSPIKGRLGVKWFTKEFVYCLRIT
jgi:predicted membrane chloride channel (bestrophin family)